MKFHECVGILAQHNYAELNEHAKAHQELIRRALQLRDKTIAGDITVGELIDFLENEVIAQHMLKIDRKFYSLFIPHQSK